MDAFELDKLFRNMITCETVNLYLNHNNIVEPYVVVKQNTISILEKFPNLISVDFSDNPIKKINLYNFKRNPYLTKLKIDNSEISQIEQFRFLKKIPLIRVLTCKGHKIYNISLETFAKISGTLREL